MKKDNNLSDVLNESVGVARGGTMLYVYSDIPHSHRIYLEPGLINNVPDSKVHGANNEAHLGPTGSRWAPWWPHEFCNLGWCGTEMMVIKTWIYKTEKWFTALLHALSKENAVRSQFYLTSWRYIL